MDKQGRLSLTTELCDLCNYTSGMKVWFVWEDEKTFRLVPEEDVTGEDKLIASARLDDKKRLFVPKTIREHYTGEAMVYGKKDDSHIYVSFFERVNKLMKMQEQLAKIFTTEKV